MGCTQATETKDKSIKVKTVPQGKTESSSTKKNQVDAEPHNEKKDQKDPTQMSKLFKRAETLKKIHRQRTAKFSNEDLLSDDELVIMIEKIENKKQVQSPDKIHVVAK